MRELLSDVAGRASHYLEQLGARSVAPPPDALDGLAALGGPLPVAPSDPAVVLRLLDEAGSPATVASAGGRYFGFVTGGALPAALAANWLAAAWDQNVALRVMSPVVTRLEEIALGWMIELFGLPAGSAGAFVTGATAANFTALAAARRALLLRRGWDADADGLFGAPPLRVVVGDEVHASVLKALSMLGLGRARVLRVPTDDQGRMRADALPEIDDLTILCVQAGNVNSGAFDPIAAICAYASATGAWVHVDGAFGLWAAASPAYAHLVAGMAAADSWATDGHKYLNTPYDSGVVICRHPEAMRGALMVGAAYLYDDGGREPSHYGPEFSRRARGVEVWAALRALGRAGLADLVERTCRYARRFAEAMADAGYEVLNEVVLNQALVAFGDDVVTRRTIAGVQTEGTCWCGGSVWQGRAAMRISVSSWATTADDVERSIAAILRCAIAARATESV